MAHEEAIRHANWRVLYTAATRTSLWQFIQPAIDTLTIDCPPDLKASWDGKDNTYYFPNGTQIHLAGVNNDHENDARGPRAHLIINEEAAFVDRFKYLTASIEIPMLTTTGGRILNISTPPESPAHESNATKAECKAKGNYVKRTIDENRHISQRAKAKLISEMGGPEHTMARRELWCEDVTDETRAIIPEFTMAADTALVRTVPAIGWHYPLLAMDVGFEDLHFILAGYWDFARARLCVQAEAALQRATTDRIADTIRDLETRLWTGAKREHEVVRWTDVDPRLVADLGLQHRLAVIQTAKDDLEAQVNAVRLLVKAGKIEIDPACQLLRKTLMQGIWNKTRTSFERLPGIGHSDAIAALIYMARNANRADNPYPAIPEGVSPQTHWIPPSLSRREPDDIEALREAFTRRRR